MVVKLGGFGTNLLQDLFVGANNLVVPMQMALISSPEELAALYIGANYAKENNRHLERREGSFDAIVRKLIGRGSPSLYRYEGFGRCFDFHSGGK